MQGLVPEQILERGKQAFYIPVEGWFETELKDLTDQIFSEELMKERGYFNHKYVQHILKNKEKSPFVYSKQLMCLMIFEMWHRIFIDAEKPGKGLSLNKLF
jgi:asparagine synthase (glutamine-hydrolysing)